MRDTKLQGSGSGKTYLASGLEWTLEDISSNLLTAVDLSVALGRERLRLESLVPDKGKRTIEVDEIRVTRALLAALFRELGVVSRAVDDLVGLINVEIVDHGINPMMPETWCRTNCRTLRKARGGAK